MPQTCERPGAAPGPIIQNHAGGEISVSPNLLHRADNRAALRRLLHQIDLDEHLRRRVVQQAILTASAWWWRWRAEQFHAAAPRPGDWSGRARAVELAEAVERCRETAQACLNRAELLDMEADDE